MKIIVIPDKFKGTISAREVCEIIEGEIKKIRPDCVVQSIPISDGGEGTVDTFLSALKGERIFVKVKNPFFEEIDASCALFETDSMHNAQCTMHNCNEFEGSGIRGQGLGLAEELYFGAQRHLNSSFVIRHSSLPQPLPTERIAVIEVAAACGLSLIENRADTLRATTYGVGELILDAYKKGARKILLGLGGTSTTDGGAGMMAALGAKFFDSAGKEFIPVGGTLSDIAAIDASGVKLQDAEIICLNDSLNPLFGENGAAYIYAKQKGACDHDLPVLDDGLRHFAGLTAKTTGNNFCSMPGTGAAGGIGFSVISYLGGSIKSGIDEILKIIDFESRVAGADFVITGEGSFDRQSLFGKAVLGIAGAAKRNNVPVILIAGVVKDVTAEELRGQGITAAYSCAKPEYKDFSEIKLNAKADLKEAAKKALKAILKQ